MILARGVSGELRAGYQHAARLGRWSMSIADERFVDGRWTCEAEVTSQDSFWLVHAARLELWLDVGSQRWHWRGVRVNGAGPFVIYGEGGPEIVTQ